MIKRILIAVDDSPDAFSAAQQGADLADQVHATVALLHVIDPTVAVDPTYGINHYIIERELQRGKQLLQRVRATLPAWVPIEMIVDERLPTDGINHIARDWHADLLVIGTGHGGRLSQLLLGSVADGVLRHAPCPILSVSTHSCGRRSSAIAAECDA